MPEHTQKGELMANLHVDHLGVPMKWIFKAMRRDDKNATSRKRIVATNMHLGVLETPWSPTSQVAAAVLSKRPREFATSEIPLWASKELSDFSSKKTVAK